MTANSITDITKQTYFIIAGEQSADNHGASLMKAMLVQNPEIEFNGIGGKEMIEAGLYSIEDIDKMAVMGFVEVIRHLGFFRNLSKRVLAEIDKCQPKQIILIDYPGFNLRLAKKIKEQFDIPITYYVSPQLWAWKENRIKIIRKYIDLLLVIFPFEEEWYRVRGVEAKFVGHPTFDDWTPTSKEELCKSLNLNADKQKIILYPGSRLQEVKKHLPILVQAAAKLRNDDSSLQFILGASQQINWSQWSLPNWIQIESDNPQKALECADLALVASGTATLEAAVFGTPMIIIYKMATISWWLSKLLVKVPYAGMVNIIAGKKIIPELLQENATSEKLFYTALSILKNPPKMEKMMADLKEVQVTLEGVGASKKAATQIFGFNS
ncbi:MAG: lipid-A-disaccharide synthase [Candidatus Marinimicrobia bacterium]|nr:lipid-A-disaccharide synthase [Candidatus Neomarinimicrobiota bacterium]